MKYIVELSDEAGLSCRINLSLPLRKVATDKTNSTWKVLDEGFLKYRSGGCEMHSSDPKLRAYVEGTLYLFVGDYWGVVLYDFVDKWTLVNDSGSGKVLQPWVKGCKPGAIGWAVTD